MKAQPIGFDETLLDGTKQTSSNHGGDFRF